MVLRKRIPAGAGLGGGSSNAAAALLGLSRLWQLHLPPHELHRIAAGLGSDVPFFLHGGVALAAGRGTDVRAASRSAGGFAGRDISRDPHLDRRRVSRPDFGIDFQGVRAIKSIVSAVRCRVD